MVSVNEVVWDTEPAIPLTVTVEDPVGVDAEVEMVKVEEHARRHDAGEKEAVAPAGKPEAAKETDAPVPDTRLAVTVLDADWPCTAVTSPPLDSENVVSVGAGLPPECL